MSEKKKTKKPTKLLNKPLRLRLEDDDDDDDDVVWDDLLVRNNATPATLERRRQAEEWPQSRAEMRPGQAGESTEPGLKDGPTQRAR